MCLQGLKLSPSPNLFDGIRARFRLRVEQQAQEAKEGYDNKRSSSLPPSCSPLHPCRSSSGGTGKRHRIEELSSPRRPIINPNYGVTEQQNSAFQSQSTSDEHGEFEEKGRFSNRQLQKQKKCSQPLLRLVHLSTVPFSAG